MTKLICLLALASVLFFGSCSKSASKNVENVVVNDGSRYVNDDIKAEYVEPPIPVKEIDFLKLALLITTYEKLHSEPMVFSVDSNMIDFVVVLYGQVYNDATVANMDSVVEIHGHIFYNNIHDRQHTVYFYIDRKHAFPYMIPDSRLDLYKNAVKRGLEKVLILANAAIK